jgi:hypothetical protein
VSAGTFFICLIAGLLLFGTYAWFRLTVSLGTAKLHIEAWGDVPHIPTIEQPRGE